MVTFPIWFSCRECFFMGVADVYLESPHSLVMTYTQKAIGEPQEYLDKYPNGNKIIECEKHIKELNKNSLFKRFENKQYYTTEYYKSRSLNNMLIDYPEVFTEKKRNF